VFVFVLACTAAPPPPEEPPAAPTPAPHADHAHPPDNGPHDHGAHGHMADMVTTRDKLRAELGPAYDAPVPGLDAADHTRGDALYAVHCASCHGATGKGNGPAAAGLTPPPGDFTDAFHARFYSDAGRVRVIEKGLPGTAMAAFEGVLDRQQILDVYTHVRTFRE
jgi:mono/diheme cytochrome c family protein